MNYSYLPIDEEKMKFFRPLLDRRGRELTTGLGCIALSHLTGTHLKSTDTEQDNNEAQDRADVANLGKMLSEEWCQRRIFAGIPR